MPPNWFEIAGVLQVEALAQLGGIVMMDPEKDAASQQNFFFGGIEGCKFRRAVVPGDTLVRSLIGYSDITLTILSSLLNGICLQMMRVDLTKFSKRAGLAKVSAKAYVGPDLACQAELTLILAR